MITESFNTHITSVLERFHRILQTAPQLGFNTHITSVLELMRQKKKINKGLKFQYPYNERTRTESAFGNKIINNYVSIPI